MTEGSGAPTDSTQTNYLFYADTDLSTVYVNNSRVAGVLHPTGATWVQVESADVLATTGSVLQADT